MALAAGAAAGWLAFAATPAWAQDVEVGDPSLLERPQVGSGFDTGGIDTGDETGAGIDASDETDEGISLEGVTDEGVGLDGGVTTEGVGLDGLTTSGETSEGVDVPPQEANNPDPIAVQPLPDTPLEPGTDATSGIPTAAPLEQVEETPPVPPEDQAETAPPVDAAPLPEPVPQTSEVTVESGSSITIHRPTEAVVEPSAPTEVPGETEITPEEAEVETVPAAQ